QNGNNPTEPPIQNTENEFNINRLLSRELVITNQPLLELGTTNIIPTSNRLTSNLQHESNITRRQEGRRRRCQRQGQRRREQRETFRRQQHRTTTSTYVPVAATTAALTTTTATATKSTTKTRPTMIPTLVTTKISKTTTITIN
ncbi:unnamed protein product, partial [Rotaria sp. Silwood2]